MKGRGVSGAEVIVAGIGRTMIDAQSLARFFVPDDAYYAVAVKYPGHRGDPLRGGVHSGGPATPTARPHRDSGGALTSGRTRAGAGRGTALLKRGVE